MKNKFFAISFSFFMLLFYFLPSFLSAGQELPFDDPQQSISMDFQDAGLKDILKIFSIQSGLNFIASEAVEDRRITLYLDKVPIKDALDKLFKVNNLYYEAERESNIFIVKDWGRPTVETVTRVFSLKYLSVPSSSIEKERGVLQTATTASTEGSSGTGSEGGSSGSSSESSSEKNTSGGGILKIISEVLSEYGKLSEDSSTNSIIVTDIPSRMPVIEQLIASLDVPRPQVMLEVEMLDVSRESVDKLGIKFGQNPFTLILPGGFRGMEFFMGDIAYRKVTSIMNATAGGLIFGSTYAEVLDFLKTQTDTKYLARPRILTLNNETAEIYITTQEAIGVKTTSTSTGAGGSSGVSSSSVEAERYQTGVSLRVTPQINQENGEITMVIIPTVSEAKTGGTFGTGSSTQTFKDPEIRSTKSMVRVKDGETIVLGGLIRNEVSETDTKVPFLSDLPILGVLFRHKDRTKDKERELLVFITPRIVRDSDLRLSQSKKTIIPFREQSTLSAFNRQKTINSILNNLEK